MDREALYTLNSLWLSVCIWVCVSVCVFTPEWARVDCIYSISTINMWTYTVSMREQEGEYKCTHSLGVCVHVCEREVNKETGCVCVYVRGEAEWECQHCVELMCQMSVERVRVSPPRGWQGVKTPITRCLDSCHCRHKANVYLVSSDWGRWYKRLSASQSLIRNLLIPLSPPYLTKYTSVRKKRRRQPGITCSSIALYFPVICNSKS